MFAEEGGYKRTCVDTNCRSNKGQLGLESLKLKRFLGIYRLLQASTTRAILGSTQPSSWPSFLRMESACCSVAEIGIPKACGRVWPASWSQVTLTSSSRRIAWWLFGGCRGELGGRVSSRSDGGVRSGSRSCRLPLQSNLALANFAHVGLRGACAIRAGECRSGRAGRRALVHSA